MIKRYCKWCDEDISDRPLQAVYCRYCSKNRTKLRKQIKEGVAKYERKNLSLDSEDIR